MMNVIAAASKVRVPIQPDARSANELKNLRHEVDDVSRQEDGNLFWQVDKNWRNFRKHPSGNACVAGSSQADPSQLRRIFSDPNLGFDVDLREEPHGFVRVPSSVSPDGWLSVARTNISNWPDPGIGKKQLGHEEKKLLKQAMKTGKLDYFHIASSGSAKKEKAAVEDVETEKRAIKAINKDRVASGLDPVEYYRIPITDEMPPTPKAVDQLVAIHNKAASAGKGIYFHCSHGHGRTTTAMVLEDIMNGKAADQAIAGNAALPGKDLRTIDTSDATNPVMLKGAADRLGLIRRFGDYWNSSSRNSMTFEQYLKENPIDAAYENQMMASLSIVNKPAG